MLIPIQWLLIGGFPLIHPRNWWAEPGAFITLWTLLAAVLVLVSDWLYEFPLLFAAITWFWWFALLLLKPLRFLWRQLRQHFPMTSNPVS
jgi:hypothetical protein